MDLPECGFPVHWKGREGLKGYHAVVAKSRPGVEVMGVECAHELLEGRFQIINVCHRFPFHVAATQQPYKGVEFVILCHIVLSRYYKASS